MGRAPCCDKASVRKGPWSPEEDAKLKEFIDKYGTGGNWIALPHKAGLKRCGKSCRLRWLNYLRPNIKHGEFSDDEDRIIWSLYASIGSRWSIIAAQLPGRTDNDIKNYWNTKLKKKLLALLPSFQKKPSFYPSVPLQSPPPLYDHHKSDPFMNPNFMNVNNNINTLLLTNTTTLVHDHVNVTDLLSPLPPLNPLISMMSNNSYRPGFQDDHQSMYNIPVPEYHYPAVKKRMLMFGGDGGGEASTTCSSPDGGGSCLTQISYNRDHHQIKQEDLQFPLQGFGDQSHGFMTYHHYIDQKPKGYFKNLEEVKQLIGNDSSSSSIGININSLLFNDDDENKTIHNQKGMCCYY